MPVLHYVKCPKCGKRTFFEYVPSYCIEDSFWFCRACYHKLKNIDNNIKHPIPGFELYHNS